MKILLVFATISAFRGLSYGITTPFFNVFFAEQLLASTALIGAIFFASQAVSLPSALSAPTLATRWGAIQTLTPCRLIGALALAALGDVDSLYWGVGFFLLFWAAEGMGTPIEMALGTQKLPRAYWGQVQSVRVTGFQLLSALGSISAGELIVRIGYGPTFGLGALALVACVPIILVSFGWKRSLD